MFENVIVGVDGADGGRDALALARVLRKEDSALTLAYVYPSALMSYRGPDIDASERESGREVLQRAGEEAGVEAQLRVHGAPSAGRGLHELAEAIGADLLVVGSSRRGLLGRVLIGDDTQGALNGAPCAVAIAPAGYSGRTVEMREIGVGYDGSPESEHALGVARNLAAAHGTKLSAFEAVFFPARAYTGFEWPGRSIEETVAATRDRIAGLGGVQPHASYGLPGEELARYSDSLDLLVIGSRSYGPAGRLVHGSTAQQLARTAHCPLLILTRAARQAAVGVGGEGQRESASTTS